LGSPRVDAADFWGFYYYNKHIINKHIRFNPSSETNAGRTSKVKTIWPYKSVYAYNYCYIILLAVFIIIVIIIIIKVEN